MYVADTRPTVFCALLSFFSVSLSLPLLPSCLHFPIFTAEEISVCGMKKLLLICGQ